MAVLRALARPMLASIFIAQGYDTLRHPEKVAPRAEKVVGPLKERVDALPDNTEQLVRINGGVQLVAGSLLAIGKFPRLSALALAATLVPTTLAGHPYWEAKDDQERAQQRIHFLKNLTMLGGLLIAAADTEGNPSLAWRSRHAVEAARHDVSLATRTAKASGKVGATVGKAAGHGRPRAGQGGSGQGQDSHRPGPGGPGPRREGGPGPLEGREGRAQGQRPGREGGRPGRGEGREDHGPRRVPGRPGQRQGPAAQLPLTSRDRAGLAAVTLSRWPRQPPLLREERRQLPGGRYRCPPGWGMLGSCS